VGVISDVDGEKSVVFEGVSIEGADPEVSGVTKLTEAQADKAKVEEISGIRN
jgi:hypothetical protein